MKAFYKMLFALLGTTLIFMYFYQSYIVKTLKNFNNRPLNFSKIGLRKLPNFCSMQTCFNFKNCNISNFKAFVYPNAVWNKHAGTSIYGKSYLTKQPKNACIYIFFWIPGSNLTSLKFWQKSGINHIVINFDINEKGPLYPDHALVAQPQFPLYQFRAGFDYILPFYDDKHSNETWKILPPFWPIKRKYWMSFLMGSNRTLNTYELQTKRLTDYLTRQNNLLRPIKVFSECFPSDIWKCSKNERLQILTNSSFSVIMMPPYLFNGPYWAVFQIHLIEILRSGSIPILIGEEEYLPLQDSINWRNILISVNFDKLDTFLPYVASFTDSDILRLKQQGRHVIEMLFSSQESLLAVILESMYQREGLPIPCFDSVHAEILYKYQPKSMKPNLTYEQPGSFREGKMSLFDLRIPPEAISFVDPELSPGRSWPQEKFTVVMMTYKRENILYKILSEYRNTPYLDRIVLVWNDISKAVNTTLIPKIDVPIYVVSNGKNSLNNRFEPLGVIRTDAILTIDDDKTLPKESIMLAFRIWKQNRDRLVGFPGRYHAWSKSEHRYLYKGDYKVAGLSMVLTSACFFHKHYSYIYTYIMNPAIRDFINKNLNCEDIAMNFLVAHVTRKPPIKVSTKIFYHCKYCTRSGISKTPKHNIKRIQCLNLFPKVYGYMPLIFTQFSSDYILEKKRYKSYLLSDI